MLRFTLAITYNASSPAAITYTYPKLTSIYMYVCPSQTLALCSHNMRSTSSRYHPIVWSVSQSHVRRLAVCYAPREIVCINIHPIPVHTFSSKLCARLTYTHTGLWCFDRSALHTSAHNSCTSKFAINICVWLHTGGCARGTKSYFVYLNKNERKMSTYVDGF